MENADKDKLKIMAQDLVKKLQPVFDAANHYATMSCRTPDEEKEYQKLLAVLQKAIPALGGLTEFFENELFREAVAYYYMLKEKAAEGDPEIQAIVRELAPLFGEALMDKFDIN